MKNSFGIKLCLFAMACVLSVILMPAEGTASRAAKVSTVRFDSKGQRLAIGKDDGSISVYDKSSGKKVWGVPPTSVKIYANFFRADDSQVLAVEYGGNIKVFDASSGRLLRRFEPNFLRNYDGRSERIHSTDMDPSGNVLALEGFLFKIVTFVNLDVAIKKIKGGELRLAEWIRSVSSPVYTSEKSRKEAGPAYMGEVAFDGEEADLVTDLKFCRDEKHIAATTRSGRLLVWKFQPADSSNPHLLRVSDVESYSRQVGDHPEFRDLFGLDCSEKHVLTVGHFSKHGQMQLWDLETGEMLQHTNQADPGTALRVKFDQSGRFAVTTGDLRYVLWEIKDNKLHALGKMYFNRNGYGWDYLNSVDFSPSETLVALGVSARVNVIDIPSLTIVSSIGEGNETLEVIPFAERNQSMARDRVFAFHQ